MEIKLLIYHDLTPRQTRLAPLYVSASFQEPYCRPIPSSAAPHPSPLLIISRTSQFWNSSSSESLLEEEFMPYRVYSFPKDRTSPYSTLRFLRNKISIGLRQCRDIAACIRNPHPRNSWTQHNLGTVYWPMDNHYGFTGSSCGQLEVDDKLNCFHWSLSDLV